MADKAWQSCVRARALVGKIHCSHAMWAIPGFVYCNRCGGHASESVRLLSSPCSEQVTSQRKTILERLRGGKHPKTGMFLGDCQRVTVDDLVYSAQSALSWLKPG